LLRGPKDSAEGRLPTTPATSRLDLYAAADASRYILVMPADHMLVLAVDGLRASALGAYGNTSFSTPMLDRLAAESFLLDSCFAGSTELPLIYRALWHSADPRRPLVNVAKRPGIASLLAARGCASTLVTDEPQLKSLPGASEFDHCVEVSAASLERADEVSQTSLARLFAAACEVIDGATAADRPQLVWVHSRGMYGPWDAPLELQASLLDESDPPPRDVIEPPNLAISATDDPDTAFVCGCAYAAQTMVLDACVDALLSALQEAPSNDRWLFVLIGIRGYPLGEHQQVGGVDERLFVEQMHVPWLLRMPDGSGRLARSRQLTTHVDLLPTLLAWIGEAAPAESVDGMNLAPLLSDPAAPWRDAILSVGSGGGCAIRTADWCLRGRLTTEQPGGGPDDEPAPGSALYVRPDDRWEANDVADLCPEVVETLSDVVREQARHIQAGQSLSPLWLPRPEPDSIV
jgi:arylsulfatase A-like enzyme